METILKTTWRNMKNRCDNPNHTLYEYYGGRGITYDKRWKLFKNFCEDMLPTYEIGLSLDRINNDGNYTKENCKWATQKEQAKNRRKYNTSNVKKEKIVVADKEFTKTNTMKLLERVYNKPIEDLLREDYIDNRLSIKQLAKKYGISDCTAQQWLVLFGVPRRKLTFI